MAHPPLKRDTVWRALFRAQTPESQAHARTCIARLVDVNDPGSTGVSLLMTSSRFHRAFATQALLDAGADPNQTDRVPGSPLSEAASLHYVFTDWGVGVRSMNPADAIEVLKILLDAGANPHAPNLWSFVCDHGPSAAAVFLSAFAGLPVDPWTAPLKSALTTPGFGGVLGEDGPPWVSVWETLRQRGALPANADGSDPWVRVLADPTVAAHIEDYDVEDTEHFQNMERQWHNLRLAHELDGLLAVPDRARRLRL